MEIAWILGGLFLFCTMGFVVVAVFLPELVGIQGRKSQEIEAQHRSIAPHLEESRQHEESQNKESPNRETPK